MWIYENSTGKRTDASIENAREMVKEGCGFSALWPRGTPEQEAAEFARLEARDLALVPEKPAAPADEPHDGRAVEEVHVARSRHERQRREDQ